MKFRSGRRAKPTVYRPCRTQFHVMGWSLPNTVSAHCPRLKSPSMSFRSGSKTWENVAFSFHLRSLSLPMAGEITAHVRRVHFDRSPAPPLLFAILDWGMGHAADLAAHRLGRRLGARVTIASGAPPGLAGCPDGRVGSIPKAGAAWSRVEKPGSPSATPKASGPCPHRSPDARLRPEHRRRAQMDDRVCRGARCEHVFGDNCYGAWRAFRGSNVFLSHRLNPPVPAAVRGGPHRSFAAMREPLTKCGSPTPKTLSSPADWHAISTPTRYIGPLSQFQVEHGATWTLWTTLQPSSSWSVAPSPSGLRWSRTSGPASARWTTRLDPRG